MKAVEKAAKKLAKERAEAPVKRGPKQGRPLLYPDQILSRFVAGTKNRIEECLKPGENVVEFVRVAVEALLKKRGV